MMGSFFARYNLGCAEIQNGNYQRAMKHFMIAAKCGLKNSFDQVKVGFRQFETTLRDYQASCDETKSEQNDRVNLGCSKLWCIARE